MDKNKQKNSFCKWIEPVSFNYLPKDLQEQIAQANAYTKKFDFHSFLKLMLHAVSNQKDSLRDVEAALFNPQLQQEIGFESLSISQLSRTLRRYDAALLEELFSHLIFLIHLEEKGFSRSKAYIIDSTTFPLNKTRYPWAEFRTTKSGVKLHLRLALLRSGDAYPDKLSNDGFFFVSRIKKNTLTHVMNRYTVAPESTIVSDQMVALGGSNAYLTDPYRLVEVSDTQGNPLRLISNRFDLSAEEISQIYRSRWEIELFFKHLKQ